MYVGGGRVVVPTEFHSDIRLRSHCTQVVQITVAIDTGGSGVRFALSERDSNTYMLLHLEDNVKTLLYSSHQSVTTSHSTARYISVNQPVQVDQPPVNSDFCPV